MLFNSFVLVAKKLEQTSKNNYGLCLWWRNLEYFKKAIWKIKKLNLLKDLFVLELKKELIYVF